MDKSKYAVLYKAIIDCLQQKAELSHTELKAAVISYLEKRNIQFEGSVAWHMEWVKLDMEARAVLKRIKSKTSSKIQLV